MAVCLISAFSVVFLLMTSTSTAFNPRIIPCTKEAMKDATKKFKADWCKQRMNAYDWKSRLKTCFKDVQWETPLESSLMETDPNESYAKTLNISPAGYFSSIVIQTVSKNKILKTTGGDFFRVYISGPSNLTATVIDHDDGTYELLFLAMVPGVYEVQVILDYTLCKGIKDPPQDWFARGCLHGSFQPPGSLHGRDHDYINKPLQKTIGLQFIVEPSLAQCDKELEAFKDAGHLGCKDECYILWDGYGTWIDNQWIPYVPGLSIAGSGHTQGQGVLWVFGDSLNRYFFESISTRPLCWQVFRACYFTMTWVYILRHTSKEETDIKNGGKSINIPRIINELKSVLIRPEMDENSALLLNAGVHLLKSSGFYVYQKIINGMIMLLKEFYRGTVIWKTTTSIGTQRDLYSGCFRRFHTEQRIDLFNSYAMTAMCRAGFLVLDVYPLTSSYPEGTVDGVHYNSTIFKPAEDILENYFTT